MVIYLKHCLKALFESTMRKHYEKALDLSIQLMAVIYNNDA